MCLVLSGSVLHFDIALLWKFTNHDDFAQEPMSRSMNSTTFLSRRFHRRIYFLIESTLNETPVGVP